MNHVKDVKMEPKLKTVFGEPDEYWPDLPRGNR
jgi:hypothetical protein